MEKLSGLSANYYEPIELPPGFRFHPSDEELITHYLCPKVVDSSLTTKAIGEVDLNKVEPWDLPWKAKMGEKEWYFFCVKDRKYPTGLRTNRATEAGYWKATGKDKEIFRAKILVGMKKTLVFYRGRAPKGEKTNWVMHEYRLEGKNSRNNISKDARNEWVICRIFKKSSGGKKVHISGLLRNTDIVGNHSHAADLPPLMDVSSDENQARTNESNVTCFSNPTEDPRVKPRDEFTSSSSRNRDFSQTPFNFHRIPVQNSNFSPQIIPGKENTSDPDPLLMQDQSMLRFLMENSFSNMKQSLKAEDISSALSYQEMGFKPYDDHEFQVNSAAPVDLDCLWNY